MKTTMKTVTVILMIFLSTTSCVQGGFEDFFDNEDLSTFVERRKLKSDVGYVNYAEGPSVEVIVSDYGVHQKMDQAWNSMLQSCNENGRREYGFRIYYKKERGNITFSFSELVSGEFVEWGIGSHGTLNLSGPDHKDGAALCAIFHVHSSYSHAPATHHRRTGLSGADSAAVSSYPTIIFDYSSDEIEGGMAESCPIIYSYDPRCN